MALVKTLSGLGVPPVLVTPIVGYGVTKFAEIVADTGPLYESAWGRAVAGDFWRSGLGPIVAQPERAPDSPLEPTLVTAAPIGADFVAAGLGGMTVPLLIAAGLALVFILKLKK